jgi:hypothetical protein
VKLQLVSQHYLWRYYACPLVPSAGRCWLQSMNRWLHPPLLQNPACAFPRTRLLNDVPIVSGIRGVEHTTPRTCDLRFWASPYRGIAPSRRSAGSSACSALLLPITCTSPSSRQHIRGVTLGLGFLRNPSPYALRLAPAPMMSESTYEVTPFPMAMACIRRAVLSTGFLGSAGRSVLTAAGALSCAVLAPAHQPLPLGKSDDGFTTPLLALPLDAC